MMHLFDEAIDNNAAALDKDDGKVSTVVVETTSSAVVDLQDLFLRFTIDNTAETTFGFVMHSLQAKRQSSFAAGFDELQDLCLARLIDPLFEVKRTFQLTTAERRIRTLQRELRQFCKTIINEKRRAIRTGGADGGGDDASLSSTHEDLLGLFIRYGTKHTDDAQEVEALTDVILNFMVAGRDTTAAALSWTFYELSKHPTVVQLIIDEAAEVFGPADDDDADKVEPIYTYEGLNRLKYTHCVVLEALRLHPPVPVDSKFAIHSDTLPDGTYIPAKSLISYMPHAMGHNEQIYGPDVMEFKPERFFNNNNGTTATEPSPFSFSVFNAGPRLCLGKPLAMLTMKMVLVQLLPRFEFHDTMGHPGTMKWSMVGKMKDGFPVHVSRRRSCKKLDGSINQPM
jgi:long-chain fatty acid omega-monooxygenase